ncbi:MAG: cation:proton antiporter [Bacteroidales bacterium]|nr:cation:proton antiporter [Bacteroidales bacterium]
MGESHFVTDLALILISAGVTTLIFKMLKQPLVLGYIVAGFLVGPHFGLFPTVIELDNVQEWSDIGIIFLLFGLGLEFSFKKLFKMGSTAFITAGTEIITVGLMGMLIGYLMKWTTMESIFLGGMLAMSSTVIIIKAFDDLGVKKQKFADITLVVLILQDLVAIVLMVLLSTAAVGQQFAGKEMMSSILKLMFFLVLWFLIGIYILPSFFRKFKSLMNDETLLIISLGLCLSMVVLAETTGFSSALGAFVMGSLLSETIESERIDKLSKSIKDLFGAIFFVSVGMMVDPVILKEYWLPIVILTLFTIFGKTICSAIGVLISGQNLKTSLQVGFSLSQIGEFAFIIATLGTSLHVLSAYIYPVIVAVSVITTFTTPYCIRYAGPIAGWVELHLPDRFASFLNRYASAGANVNVNNDWSKLIKSYIVRISLYSVVVVALILSSFTWFYPFVQTLMDTLLANVICTAVTILVIAPFLRGMVIQKKEESVAFTHLWSGSRYNRGVLVALLLLRIFLVIFFISMVLFRVFSTMSWNLVVVMAAVVLFVLFSRNSFRRFSKIERQFYYNLNHKQEEQRRRQPIRSSIDSQFSGKDIHLAKLEVSPDCSLVGLTISQSRCYEKFGVSIVKIERGSKDIYLPNGQEHIYPGDVLVVLGGDSKISAFNTIVTEVQSAAATKEDRKDMMLASFVVGENSSYLGKSIAESGIWHTGNCMVVGINRNGEETFNPPMQTIFEQDDLVWIVGERSNVKKVIN